MRRQAALRTDQRRAILACERLIGHDNQGTVVDSHTEFFAANEAGPLVSGNDADRTIPRRERAAACPWKRGVTQ
jgi:hypothetical protein